MTCIFIPFSLQPLGNQKKQEVPTFRQTNVAKAKITNEGKTRVHEQRRSMRSGSSSSIASQGTKCVRVAWALANGQLLQVAEEAFLHSKNLNKRKPLQHFWG